MNNTGHIEQVSVFLSQTLDTIGLNQHIIQARRLAYDEVEKVLNGRGNERPIYIRLYGLHADGVSTPLQSAYKLILVPKDVRCVARGSPGYHGGESVTVLECDFQTMAPGLVTLKLCAENFNGEHHSAEIRRSTFSDVVWGSMFQRFMDQKYGLEGATERNMVSGPLIENCIGTHTHRGYGLEADIPVHLRPGASGWPCEGVIADISRETSLLVPAFVDECEDHQVEWSVTTIMQERVLFKNLQPVQVKLFYLLKTMSLLVQKSTSLKIGSRILRNIVFFMVETVPQGFFTDENLTRLLTRALSILEQHIQAGVVPCYFYREQNILSASLREPRKRTLVINCLQQLQRENVQAFLKCDKLRQALINAVLHAAFRYRIMSSRNVIEVMVLNLNFYQYQLNTRGSTMNDKEKNEIQQSRRRDKERLYNMILPNWRSDPHTEVDAYVYKTVKSILS